MHRRGTGWAFSQQEAAELSAALFTTFVFIQVLMDTKGEMTKLAGARLVETINRVRPLLQKMIDSETKGLHEQIHAEINERIEENGLERYTKRQVTRTLQAGRSEDRDSGGTGEREASQRRPKQVKIGSDASDWVTIESDQLDELPAIGPMVTCPVCSREHPVLPHSIGPMRIQIVDCPDRPPGKRHVLVGIEGKDVTALRRDQG
jgi:hypothetical protein